MVGGRPVNDQTSESEARGCRITIRGLFLGVTWAWLVVVAFISFMALLGLDGCEDLECEHRYYSWWKLLMLTQGVLLSGGLVASIKTSGRTRLVLMSALAVLSPLSILMLTRVA